uniref:Uncharacterized protein n=1 Tax=Oryza meridionalis TaxID=40149 RepID=A0A0E0DBI7_9ORYZ
MTTTSPPSALSSPLSSIGGSFRAMQIRNLSGCYLHCHSVLDPRTLAAATAIVFSCSDYNKEHPGDHLPVELAEEERGEGGTRPRCCCSWLSVASLPSHLFASHTAARCRRRDFNLIDCMQYSSPDGKEGWAH